jgi:hypothetical protein
MFVGRRAVLVSVTAMFVGRSGVLFGVGVTAVVMVMSRVAVMMCCKFVMRRRHVMMLAGWMLGFRHGSLLSVFSR